MLIHSRIQAADHVALDQVVGKVDEVPVEAMAAGGVAVPVVVEPEHNQLV
jgi:hypothetical protein